MDFALDLLSFGRALSETADDLDSVATELEDGRADSLDTVKRLTGHACELFRQLEEHLGSGDINPLRSLVNQFMGDDISWSPEEIKAAERRLLALIGLKADLLNDLWNDIAELAREGTGFTQVDMDDCLHVLSTCREAECRVADVIEEFEDPIRFALDIAKLCRHGSVICVDAATISLDMGVFSLVLAGNSIRSGIKGIRRTLGGMIERFGKWWDS
ncbi:hypothetical protein GRI58_06030 [Porphyrobacter algicida]|uniref:Uncharacterized protein n=1 Tax=Qipengyuania algicida TaxID=1836209 RepID=A0A845ADR5_9SPHN|nr:hypothetical protein [Qipengyuania algicida]MXP28380.1 hypothetical protein [Qipengyuania algicida]